MKWIVTVRVEGHQASFVFPTKQAQEGFIQDIEMTYGKTVDWIKTTKGG
jgi:hypothetical protein